jgi:hypothetical protein
MARRSLLTTTTAFWPLYTVAPSTLTLPGIGYCYEGLVLNCTLTGTLADGRSFVYSAVLTIGEMCTAQTTGSLSMAGGAASVPNNVSIAVPGAPTTYVANVQVTGAFTILADGLH